MEKQKNEVEKISKPISELVSGNQVDYSQLQNLERQIQDATVINANLLEEYWNPGQRDAKGETKKLLFKEVRTVPYTSELTDKSTGEVTTETTNLDVAYFVEVKKGEAKVIKNASWRLVNTVKNYPSGAAFEITYVGKQKNSNSSFLSDNWSIKPLILG